MRIVNGLFQLPGYIDNCYGNTCWWILKHHDRQIDSHRTKIISLSAYSVEKSVLTSKRNYVDGKKDMNNNTCNIYFRNVFHCEELSMLFNCLLPLDVT